MKTKIMLAIVTAIAMAGCTNEEPLSIPQNNADHTSQNTVARSRSIDEVIELANNLAAGIRPNSRSNQRIASRRDAVCAIGTPSSRSGGIADTLLYAVNFDNGQGYALIAAPENVDPIIGIVDEGEFATLETLSNEGFQFYLTAAQNYIRTMSITGPTDPPIIIKPMYNDIHYIYNDTIAPRVQVKWGQHYPEGYYCSNKVAGCVMTAMVQMLSYIEAPSKITLTYPERDRSEQVLDWKEIKKHKESIGSNLPSTINLHLAMCDASKESHLALARLARELGHRNNADYNSPTETKSNIDAAYSTLRSLLPGRSMGPIIEYGVGNGAEYSDLTLFANMTIDNGVIFMGGSEVPSVDTKAGHAWVLDGGLRVGNVTYRTYTINININSDQKTFVTDRHVELLFHFNWGWCGQSNGYFLPNVFKPGESVKYDDNSIPNSDDSDFCVSVKYFRLS